MSRTARHVAAALVASLVGIVLCTTAVAWHEGYRAYVVRTGSMMPTFHPGDAVIDRPANHGYDVGDSITFEVAPGSLVTHRLRWIDRQGKLHTKGDANAKSDVWALAPEQVRGVVAQGLPNVGYVLVFLRQKTGVAGVMTSALSLFLLWGLCFPVTRERRVTAAERADDAAPSVPRQRQAVVPVPGAPALPPPLPPPDRGVPVTASLHLTNEQETPKHIPAPRGPAV